MGQAQRTMDRWRGALRGVSTAGGEPHSSVVEALCDDLNTPQALAALGALAKKGDWPSFKASADLLGLDVKPISKAVGTYDGKTLDYWIEERRQAKTRRDFGEADRIRELLRDYGVTLEDRPDGTTEAHQMP